MKCAEARQWFSPLLDSELEAAQAVTVERHIRQCEECGNEYSDLHANRRMLAGLGRVMAPPDLERQLRVAAAQHLGAKGSRWTGMLVRWENVLNAFMFPAAAGLVSAVVIFGLLIGVLVPAHRVSYNDVPTSLYTPPEMTSTPFGLGAGVPNGEALMVEAIIDPHGRVQDYRVLSATGTTELTPEMKNALIFTQFRPATNFGLPTSGRVVISFSNISVGG
jgi:predicted anti-sigma-YlaC factor YlaD